MRTAAARDIEGTMLPPPRQKPKMRNTGVYVAERVLDSAGKIARDEDVKSRNLLLGSLLTFAVDLYPLLKPLRRRIEDTQRELGGVEYHVAIAHLVKRGLDR